MSKAKQALAMQALRSELITSTLELLGMLGKRARPNVVHVHFRALRDELQATHKSSVQLTANYYQAVQARLDASERACLSSAAEAHDDEQVSSLIAELGKHLANLQTASTTKDIAQHLRHLSAQKEAARIRLFNNQWVTFSAGCLPQLIGGECGVGGELLGSLEYAAMSAPFALDFAQLKRVDLALHEPIDAVWPIGGGSGQAGGYFVLAESSSDLRESFEIASMNTSLINKKVNLRNA